MASRQILQEALAADDSAVSISDTTDRAFRVKVTVNPMATDYDVKPGLCSVTRRLHHGMLNRIDHIYLSVSNFSRSQSFYDLVMQELGQP